MTSGKVLLGTFLTLVIFIYANPLLPQEESSSDVVVVIGIRGTIDEGLAAYVERVMKEVKATEKKPDLIMLEINTPGGMVDSCLRIAEALSHVKPIRTCAYVTHTAWSGGALVALACKEIYMGEAASIGSAEPIALTPEGAVEVGEKYVSALRAEFRTQAENNGYPPNIAAAMVDKDLEVLEVKVDSERKFLTRAEFEQERDKASKTSGAKEVELVRTVSESGKLLNLTAREAVEYGVAKAVVENEEEIFDRLGLGGAAVLRKEITWSESLVRFLTSPLVVMVLLAAGLLGLWMEFKAPGVGLPGAVAVVCFGLLFFGKYLAGLVSVIDLMILFLGVGLLLLELFVIPGFGITGFTGIALIIVGLVLSLQGFVVPKKPWEVAQLWSNLFMVVFGFSVSLAAAFALVTVLGERLSKVPVFGRLVLASQVRGTAGMEPAQEGAVATIVGKRGVAETDLRPAGKARIGDDVYDVVSRGEYIRRGAALTVIDKVGVKIMVKVATDESTGREG